MRAKVKHTNRGFLFSDRQSRRLPTEMRLSGRAITIEAGGQVRRYPIETVDIRRHDGNTFEILIGDHGLYYESDRPIKFTFEFLPAMGAMRRKRKGRDRPTGPRPSKPSRTPEPTRGHFEQARGFDEPSDEPWTDLALGHEQVNLIEAVSRSHQRASRNGHTHDWEQTIREGQDVQVCAECRQVLIDISDSAAAERSTPVE